MIFKNKTYDIIKWIVLAALPAISAFVGTIGVAYGWTQTELIVITINAVTVLLGGLTGFSGHKYNQKEEDNYE